MQGWARTEQRAFLPTVRITQASQRHLSSALNLDRTGNVHEENHAGQRYGKGHVENMFVFHWLF